MRATAQQYAQAWYGALTESPATEWDGISQSFMKHMHHKGDMGMVSEVQRIIALLEREDKGIVRVVVRTAHVLDEQTITDAIRRVFGGTEVAVETVIDETIIGGLQIETDDSRWDLSLRGQLRALEQQLTA